MRILIVEDEVIAGDFLEKLITDHFIECKVIGKARTVQEAVELFSSLQPDVLIMDINLGDHLSFELFGKLSQDKLNVIFTTGYQKYAFKAFKVNAIDYVLKPVNLKNLKIAIIKAKDKLLLQQMAGGEAGFLGEDQKQPECIVLWENDKLKQVELDQVIKIKSDRSYSVVFLSDEREILTSKNLGFYEELLKENGFFRVHKSCLINMTHFVSYHSGINAKVELSNFQFEAISRRKKDELMQLVKKYK